MKIQYDNKVIEMDDKFSQKDFTNKFVDIPNGVNVYATVFSREIPDSEPFRKDMKGVTFYNCNLDNCVVPEGNTLVGGSNKRFEAQNDGNDWLVDKDNKPVEPLNSKIFVKLNLPIPNPKDIPAEKVKEAIDLVAVAQAKTQ